MDTGQVEVWLSEMHYTYFDYTWLYARR